MLPELESIRRQTKAAPELRSGNLTAGELGVELAHALFEFSSTRDHAALGTGVRAELTAAPTSREVGVGLAHGHLLDGALHTNLSTAWFAVPEDRSEGILRELSTLSRFVVREPTDGVIINVTK
jgi:hypothetical protein